MRPVALLGFTLIALLGAAGAERERTDGRHWGRIDLDGERTIPAFASSLLLVFAALCAGLAGRARVGQSRWAWIALSLVFLFMACDEWFVVHEHLQTRLGIDWDLLYLPLMAGAGGLWLRLLLRLRTTAAAAALWLGAGVAWLAAVILEVVQWDALSSSEASRRSDPAYQILMVNEEVLELVGSFLFGLAALVALRRIMPVGRPGRRS